MALSRTRRLTSLSAKFFGTGSYVSSSFTPANSSILVARISAVTENGDSFAGGDLSISGGGLTWTAQVASTTSPNWTYGDRVWTAPVTTGASMTITASNVNARNINSYIIEVDEFTGAAASYVGATALGSDADGDGTGSLTLSGAPASDSVVLAYTSSLNNGGAAVTITPGTSWTEIAENGVTDYITFESEWITGITGTSLTAWSDLAATGAALGATMVAIEIKAAGGGTQSFSYTAVGGLTLGGAAPKTSARAKAGAGGLTISGAATQVRKVARAAAGGIVIAGAAAFAKGKTAAPSGGLQLAGASALARVTKRSGAGGLQLAGAAGFTTSGTQQYSYVASGGLTLGGAAAQLRKITRTVAGGLQFGGAATAAIHEQQRVVVPAGGLLIRGAASVQAQTAGGSSSDNYAIRRRRRLR
jgi:hypothetical protein